MVFPYFTEQWDLYEELTKQYFIIIQLTNFSTGLTLALLEASEAFQKVLFRELSSTSATFLVPDWGNKSTKA
jgi:hypothetical protein